MSRFLMVDVGAGTMDVLYFDDGRGLQYKAVVKSPVLYVCENAAKIQGRLLITGCEMGGGALAQALQERAGATETVMSR